MYHALYIPTFFFYIVRSMFPFLFNRSQLKAIVVNQMSHHFFWSSKLYFFCFQLFENGHINNVASTLISVVKLDVENNNIVWTLSNVVNINIEIGNDSTLLNVVNFNVGIHNVVSTPIWDCSMSRRHITLTTTLRQRWNVRWYWRMLLEDYIIL